MAWGRGEYIKVARSKTRSRLFECGECGGHFDAPASFAYSMMRAPACPMCVDGETREAMRLDLFKRLVGEDDDDC